MVPASAPSLRPSPAQHSAPRTPSVTPSARRKDLLRGSILYNTNTAQGLALHLTPKPDTACARSATSFARIGNFHSMRADAGIPKTVADLMKREDGGAYSGSRRASWSGAAQ